MKLFLSLAAAIVVAGVFWKFSDRDADTGSFVDGATAPVIVPAGEPLDDENSALGPSSDAVDAEGLAENADISANEANEQAGNAAQNPSPFSVVTDGASSELAEDIADTTSEQDLPSTLSSAQLPITNDDGDAGSLAPVSVPSSYPVTEAAKYFVPREQRGPGNLGGPPPLDFPGGPSDPNRQDSPTFQPPESPGQ